MVCTLLWQSKVLSYHITSVYLSKITDKANFLKICDGYIYLYLLTKWVRKHSLVLQPAGMVQKMSMLVHFFLLQNKVATSKLVPCQFQLSQAQGIDWDNAS